MSDGNSFAISGDGVGGLIGGPVSFAWFVADAVPDNVKVVSSVTPERLKYAGWVSFGSLNGGDPNTEVWTPPWWLDFANCFVSPVINSYFGHVRWSLKPGFSGLLWVWTN